MGKINRKFQVTVRQQKRPNLPKAAVNILTKWLEENCTNPYPSESTKKTLMEVTKLTKNQIYNWFINSRRRILPNILKEKDMDKSLILLKIKKFTCFNRNKFAHHFENKTQCTPNKPISYSETKTTSKNEEYNLQLLAEVATKLPRITPI
ncbi:Homeobox domain,Homeobox domain-like,Homeobox KN domain [Cinara cedri]|uniref:Homeobox domain,Homeobox domain-like,Homeobox KN domain n=1 Tax=Cinara cedri TaxID=506608 RepID=A0A5E4MPU7_9HEMI|nr:Homeobox domain,Homeobox domain-like,Homeobox KN domain [Cinara cedri]